MDDTPRRRDLNRWTDAERAIQAATDEVERVGADPRLTNAVLLLGKARERVADFIDGVEQDPATTQPMPFAVRPFDAMIGRVDRVLSELVVECDSDRLDEADKQTLLHHADDLIGVAEAIRRKLV